MNTLAPDYLVHILTSAAELSSIVPEWVTLWREAERATPFQSPYWNVSWCDHLNPGGTLAVVTVRLNGELVALAPWRVNCEPPAGRPVLSFIGTGVSDCLDLLWRPGHANAFCSIANEIRQLDWDECHFGDLSHNSMLIDREIGGFKAHAQADSVCPVLQFSHKNTSHQGVSHQAARALDYYRRRVARSHQWAIEVADLQNADYLLAELFRLHSEIWSARGQSGVLQGRDIAKFHQHAASGFLREGILRLYLLTIDGSSAAVFYGFHWHGCTYYYLGGFAPAFARLNPGTILIGHAIEQARQEGSGEFNFLRGSERYKYWWGARDRQLYRLYLSRHQFETCIRRFQ